MLPVYEPYLGKEEAENLAECVRSGWVSYLGPFVNQFESAFKDYIGSGNAVALQSGTAALHLALLVLDVGDGDEVLLPDLSFAASAFAVTYTRAKPVKGNHAGAYLRASMRHGPPAWIRRG
jgi:perosamine synthetase